MSWQNTEFIDVSLRARRYGGREGQSDDITDSALSDIVADLFCKGIVCQSLTLF